MLTKIDYINMELASPVKTWSAREPAYKYTALCQDARFRPKKKGGDADAKRTQSSGAAGSISEIC